MLLVPDDGGGHEITAVSHLWGAIKTIVVADFIMSRDNVIAMVAASRDSIYLLLFGLAVSIPLIVASSQLILHFMERFPLIVTLGAGLLGYVAGSMVVFDALIRESAPALVPQINCLAGACGAILVITAGHWLAWRNAPARDRRIA